MTGHDPETPPVGGGRPGDAERRFPIVGIGASAGGIEALDGLFTAIGGDGGLAFVVVTHISPDHVSLLHEVLGRFTALPVAIAADGALVEPDHVYVLSSNAVLGIENGRLSIRAPNPAQRERNPIDIFFSALARDRGDYAVGIVLSGGGSDGTLGIKAIKERGGLTFAQGAGAKGSDGTAPLHSDMPASATATGLVDFTLPVEEIGSRLVAYAHSVAALDEAAREDRDATDSAQAHDEIYAILRSQVGHDFAGYKNKTFARRVRRRMQVLQIGTLDAYVAHLREEGGEVTALFRDLLINVTNFFRDAEAFACLEAEVLPRLFEQRGADETIRIWVPGCATGEEVYSIAMLMREQMDGLRALPRVQIFATDIDDDALGVARAGRYPATLLDAVSPQRLSRFFTQEGGSYAVTKEVRELCVFSPHSVIRDPPFSRIDLVSCRNLLIYFGAEMQGQVIPIFHYALRPGGYLFLGTSESISQFSGLFAAFDKKHRIFRARETERGSGSMPLPLIVNGVQPAPFARHFQRRPGDLPVSGGGASLRESVESHVLERFAPAHVVVNHEGDVVHYSSRTGKYLEAPAGLPSRQLLTMARRGLRLELRATLRQAIETRRPATRENLPVEGEEGRVQRVSITVEPLPGADDGEKLLLVLFQDLGASLSREQAETVPNESDAGMLQLERDLRDTRERLQSIIEEYETALEELKSSNEELVSVNEELQSTNEELEASKEELQSLNEELQTVNLELGGKLDELDRANGDLRNLFEATRIATVFLDRELVIRTFTPTVSQFFPIRKSDRGRKLTDFAGRLDHPELTGDLREVLESGRGQERRIVQERGAGEGRQHFLVRLMPYREADGAVAGVVTSFVDVTSLVQAEERQRALIDELNHRVAEALASILGFARETRAAACDDTLPGRVEALSRSFALLAREQWGEVALGDVVERQLAPHGPDRTVREGPHLGLTPRQAVSLGSVLHELAAESARDGALSIPAGRISATWSCEDGTVVLVWQEQDGPARSGEPGLAPIADAALQGLGGSAETASAPEGLRVRLSFPVR